VIEFLTAEKVNPTDIHRRWQTVYGIEVVDWSTVSRWRNYAYRVLEWKSSLSYGLPRKKDNCKLCPVHWDTEKLRRPVCRGSTETIFVAARWRPTSHTSTYVSHTTSTAFKQLKFEVIQHPPYLPDLAHSVTSTSS